MKTGLRDLSKFLLGGCASMLLLWTAMLMYGDTTATAYAVFMTAVYFAVCSVGAIVLYHLSEKKEN